MLCNSETISRGWTCSRGWRKNSYGARFITKMDYFIWSWKHDLVFRFLGRETWKVGALLLFMRDSSGVGHLWRAVMGVSCRHFSLLTCVWKSSRKVRPSFLFLLIHSVFTHSIQKFLHSSSTSHKELLRRL